MKFMNSIASTGRCIDLELGVIGGQEVQPLRGMARVEAEYLQLAQARAELDSFTSGRLPSSLKHYLLWGGVGVSSGVGFLSAVVGTYDSVKLSLTDGGSLSGNLLNRMQAGVEFFFAAGVSVGAGAIALRCRNVIQQENNEKLEVLFRRLAVAEQGFAAAATELSAMQWDAYIDGLDRDQVFLIAPCIGWLPEGRTERIMEMVIEGGFAEQMGAGARSPEQTARLFSVYGACGERLLRQMAEERLCLRNGIQDRHFPDVLVCMALSPEGFVSSLSDRLRSALASPEGLVQVRRAVAMLPVMANVMGIEMAHIERFRDGVGGIGAELMTILRDATAEEPQAMP